MIVSRRQFGKTLTFAAAAVLARPALGAGPAKVVVIGGGAGGATVAGHLKRLKPDLSVTLIEPQERYTSCFFSNAYIGGLWRFEDLTHGYEGLKALGVTVIHTRARAIDPVARTVTLETGDRIGWDRLAISPGIDFKWSAMEGYSEATADVMPHAWRGGKQSSLLRRRLEAMEDGGTVVITAPPLPYRCPPGPYERACVIANYLAKAKPKSKVVVLDAKMTFPKQAAFEDAIARYYSDRIEVHLTNDIDDFSVVRADPASGEVHTKAGLTIKADVANIIPPQTAGRVALDNGFADPDWCPVKPETFRSAKTDHVYILGDAAIATDMPKSAFSAHSQGLVVATDIVADLEGRAPEPGRYRNTCWSIVAPDDAIKIGADYAPGVLAGNRRGLIPANSFVSKPGESAEERKAVYDEAFAWYPTLVSQIFNKDLRVSPGNARSDKTPG